MTQLQDTATRPFVAFGQMAHQGRYAVMAFVIFGRPDLVKARKALKRAREAARVPTTLRADSTNLFTTGAPGAPISLEDTPALLAKYADALNEAHGMLRYVWIDLDKAPDHIDAADPEFRAKMQDTLINACFAVPPGGKYGPRAHECDILRVDAADRETYSTALLLDLADTLPHALARVMNDPEHFAWIQRDIDRIQYWSNMEVNVRPATPEEAAKQN